MRGYDVDFAGVGIGEESLEFFIKDCTTVDGWAFATDNVLDEDVATFWGKVGAGYEDEKGVTVWDNAVLFQRHL